MRGPAFWGPGLWTMRSHRWPAQKSNGNASRSPQGVGNPGSASVWSVVVIVKNVPIRKKECAAMIRDAYERAAKIIAARGQSPESLTVAEEVERLRLAWRPSCVRVVMLAESHVWTFERDTTSRVQQPD